MIRSSSIADLVESDGNPAPEGIAAGFIMSSGKMRLRFAVSPAVSARPRGTILLLQGRNEAIEKYFETIGDLNALGYTVATFDWRGQGGSGRLLRNLTRGHVPSFDAYVADLERVLSEVVMRECPGPTAILAHSMGGAVALLAAPRLVGRIERIVAAAPLVALAGGDPRAGKLHFAMAAMRVLGLGGLPVRAQARQTRGWTLERNPLTSDARRYARNLALIAAAPQLFVGGPTASWVAAATRAFRRLDDSDFIASLRIPSLLVTAGADTVVSSAAAERLAWRLRSGHSLSVPASRHELLQEADRYRAPFLAAADSFIGGALPVID